MLNRDFREFVQSLNASGVEYLLVGGWALGAHGQPRATGDIDFWVRCAPANVERLLAAIKHFGFGSLGLTAKDFGPDSVVQFGRPPVRIDLLTSVSGVEFDTCWPRRIEAQYGDLTIPVIGLEDLLTNKRASGRDRDLADVKALTRKPRS